MEPTSHDRYLEYCVWQNVESVYVARFPSWGHYMAYVFCFIFNIIQTFLIIFLNYLAVHALCKSAQLRRKTTLFLIMILSASDLAVGIIADPMLLLHLGREIYGTENCFFNTLKVEIMDILPAISFSTFIVLNVEIYLSIIHPIYHKTKVTNGRLLKMLGIAVFISVGRSYLFVFHIGKRVAQLVLTVIIFATLVLLAYIHIKISIVVFKRRRIGFVSVALPSIGRQSKSFLHGVKEAKSCLMVLLCTIFCYLPSAVRDGMLTETKFQILFHPWRATTALTASFLNCIVFFWRNGILRKEAKNIIQKITCNP